MLVFCCEVQRMPPRATVQNLGSSKTSVGGRWIVNDVSFNKRLVERKWPKMTFGGTIILLSSKERLQKKTILGGNFSHTGGGGCDPKPLVFVCLTSFFFGMPKSSWGAKTCFIKKKFLQEKNDIFDMGIPILGGGGGLPTCEKFPRNTVFSEDVPKVGILVAIIGKNCIYKQGNTAKPLIHFKAAGLRTCTTEQRRVFDSAGCIYCSPVRPTSDWRPDTIFSFPFHVFTFYQILTLGFHSCPAFCCHLDAYSLKAGVHETSEIVLDFLQKVCLRTKMQKT